MPWFSATLGASIMIAVTLSGFPPAAKTQPSAASPDCSRAKTAAEKAELEAQAAKEDWQLFADAEVAATVREARYWAPDRAGVDILFDPYSVAAYAFGQHRCRLSWADLAPWLKPNGPLPPH